MFSSRLKEMRKNKKLSQIQLAKLLNSAQSTVSGWESGEREPDFNMVVDIAALLDTSVDYLLGNTDNPSPPSKKEQKKETSQKEVTKEDIMFAFFGGSEGEDIEKKYADVEKFVEFLKSQDKENNKTEE